MTSGLTISQAAFLAQIERSFDDARYMSLHNRRWEVRAWEPRASDRAAAVVACLG